MLDGKWRKNVGSREALEQAGFSVEVRNLGKQSVGYEYHIIARSG